MFRTKSVYNKKCTSAEIQFQLWPLFKLLCIIYTCRKIHARKTPITQYIVFSKGWDLRIFNYLPLWFSNFPKWMLLYKWKSDLKKSSVRAIFHHKWKKSIEVIVDAHHFSHSVYSVGILRKKQILLLKHKCQFATCLNKTLSLTLIPAICLSQSGRSIHQKEFIQQR